MELNRSKLYAVWSAMKYRCNNKKCKQYHNYGGRGIKVIDLWNNSFDEFYLWAVNNGYKVGLTLDRIDNELGYSPSNCRFTDYTTQIINRRKFSNTQNSEKGIYFIDKNLKKPYKVYKYHDYKTKVIGYCATIDEAIQMRDNYEFKQLNK